MGVGDEWVQLTAAISSNQELSENKVARIWGILAGINWDIPTVGWQIGVAKSVCWGDVMPHACIWCNGNEHHQTLSFVSVIINMWGWMGGGVVGWWWWWGGGVVGWWWWWEPPLCCYVSVYTEGGCQHTSACYQWSKHYQPCHVLKAPCLIVINSLIVHAAWLCALCLHSSGSIVHTRRKRWMLFRTCCICVWSTNEPLPVVLKVCNSILCLRFTSTSRVLPY